MGNRQIEKKSLKVQIAISMTDTLELILTDERFKSCCREQKVFGIASFSVLFALFRPLTLSPRSCVRNHSSIC